MARKRHKASNRNAWLVKFVNKTAAGVDQRRPYARECERRPHDGLGLCEGRGNVHDSGMMHWGRARGAGVDQRRPGELLRLCDGADAVGAALVAARGVYGKDVKNTAADQRHPWEIIAIV